MRHEIPSALIVAAIGLGLLAAFALASTTAGACILIAAVVLAFLILGPGLTLWQRMKRLR